MTDPAAWLASKRAPAPTTAPAGSPGPSPVRERRVDKLPCPACGSPDTGLAFEPAREACDEGCCAAERATFRRWCRACQHRWRTHDALTEAR